MPTFAAVPVEAFEVQPGVVIGEVMGTGTLDARVKTTISPRIQERLAEVFVDQNDFVKAGQSLARLDDGTYGLCEVCLDPVEEDRLRVDPLIRFCVDHLDAAERAALERDLGTAARVQRALLPPQDVSAAGWDVRWEWRPHGAVSGDYCDLVPSRSGAGDLLFAVGDVAGKGVAASIETRAVTSITSMSTLL